MSAESPRIGVESLVPATDDPDSRGFWEAAARERLAVCICPTCEQWVHLPLSHCPACAGPTSWQTVAGTASVVSWAVVTHQVHPAFPVPYTILLVELDEAPGVRLIGHVPGRPPVTDGDAARVRFETVGDGVVLPQWELADLSASQRPDP